MTHFRITGLIWLVLCLAGAAAFAPHLWSIVGDRQHGLGTGFHGAGFWMLQFSVEMFLLLGVVAALGLLRLRRWGAICMRVAAVLLLLYCLIFLFISQYVEFHVAWLGESLFGIALAAYSLLVVWKFRPYDRAA